MNKRIATVAVIGAGDCIGSVIAAALTESGLDAGTILELAVRD